MIFFSARQDEEVPNDETNQPTVSALKSAVLTPYSSLVKVTFYVVLAIGKFKVGKQLPSFGFVTNILYRPVLSTNFF